MRCVTTLDLHTVPGPATLSDAIDGLPAPDRDIARDTAHTLAEGARLLDYEIVGPIGEGGFGIVYLAWDRVQEQHVAIKEYLPAVLASRAAASPAVVVKSQRHGDSFRLGMRSFVNEARILARFDHPALVKVLRFWEDNGTAYMAMPYYAGPTLADALCALGRPPEERELRGWIDPLLDAIDTLHQVHCLHRDIAPDNILLTDDGPVLLDFGAARRVIDGMGPSPTAVLKPGFAPIEQYGEAPSMKQGAWTDLYALAAVVYAAVTGQPPMAAVERLMDDRLQPLSELARGRYGAAFLAAIDATLSLHPSGRPQSVAQFRASLDGERLPASAKAAPRATVISRAPTPAAPRAEAPRPFVMPPDRATADVPAVPRRRRTKRLSAVAASVLVAGIAVAGYARIGEPARAAPPLAAMKVAPAPVPAVFDTQAIAALMPMPRTSALPPVAPLDAPDVPDALEVAPAPAAEEPAHKPVAVRALGEPAKATRREARVPAVEPSSPRAAVVRIASAETGQGHAGRCTDILQRASLEPLGAGEAALLRKGCE